MARKNVRAKGFQPVGNPELYQAMVGLRKSSAATPHASKAHKGTRTNNKRAAIREFA